MNCLVINRIPLETEDRLLRAKHYEQVEAFAKLGLDTVSVGFRENQCFLMHKGDLEPVCRSNIHGYQSYQAMFRAVDRAIQEFHSFDIAYMRMIPAAPGLLRFLKRIRPHCGKLVYEFPTFPYDAEMAREKSLIRRLTYCSDRVCRHGLKRYVDYAATFSEEPSIFGIPTIPIVNGINVSRFPLHTGIPGKGKSLRIICVAKVSEWHGLDRLIRGMGEYRRSRKPGDSRVEVDIVGEGAALKQLKDLVAQEGLREQIHFHGRVLGEALTKLFDQADIAVESLGLHRIGCAISSTLKSREYMARGIPFLYSAAIPGIEERPWAKKFPADESPIEIAQILQWVERDLQSDFGPQMRAYAEQALSWESQFAKILDFIKRK